MTSSIHAAQEATVATPATPVTSVTFGRVQGDPPAVLRGFREQRQELRNQLERLEDQRNDLREELTAERPAGVSPDKGIEARIAQLDVRIAELDKAIAEADKAVASAAAIPGAVVPPPPPPPRRGPPEEFWIFLMILTFIVAIPMSIAYARRIWRRGAQVVSAIPAEIYDRFNRIDQAVDSVAVEVERIGEGQRYLTRVMAEQRGIGAGAAEPVNQKDRAGEQVGRS